MAKIMQKEALASLFAAVRKSGWRGGIGTCFKWL
jgi:hypothetical protein